MVFKGENICIKVPLSSLVYFNTVVHQETFIEKILLDKMIKLIFLFKGLGLGLGLGITALKEKKSKRTERSALHVETSLENKSQAKKALLSIYGRKMMPDNEKNSNDINFLFSRYLWRH